MSESENLKAESGPTQKNNESAAAKAAPAQPEEPTGPHPSECFARHLDDFRQSLANEGEAAMGRWGISMLQCLNDKECESQRVAMGIAPKDEYDYYNRGCLLALREQYADAVKAFDQAIALKPDFAEAHFNRAVVLETKGDTPAARQAWQGFTAQFADHESITEIKQHLGELADA